MSKYQKSYRGTLGRKKYRSRKGRPLKKLALFGFFIFCAGGIFYFFFVSSYFQITHIEILGVETLSHKEVHGTVENIFVQKNLGFLNSKNYFFAPVEKLQASLFEQFPKIGTLNLEKIYRNTLQIHIEERDVVGVWCLASRDLAKPDGLGSCFYFDKMGVIFEGAPRSLGQLLLTVTDVRNSESNLGEVVLDEEEVRFLEDVKGIIDRNFPFGAQTIEIGETGETEIVISEGWRVLLNKNESAEHQLSNLKYVLDEQIKTRRGELEYVDLRLGNKVYYKYIGQSY